MIPKIFQHLLLATLSALIGCTSAQSNPGLANVQSDIQNQTGLRVQWDQSPSSRQQTAESIRELLRTDLTATSATQIALLNNQKIQSAFEELGIAQAQFAAAALPSNPTLTAEVRFPKHQALPLEFDITQSLLDLILWPIRSHAASATFEAAQQRTVAEVMEISSMTAQAFYRAQGAAQLAEMRRTIVSAAGASYEAAKALREAGNITALALASQQALYEQSKIELAKAEADALDARESLTAQMGLWGADINWKIGPRLPAISAAEVSPLGLESLGISRRADLAAARQDIESAAQSAGLSNFNAWGDITLGGHYERDSDGTTTVGPNLTVPIPIFNQGQPAIAAAQARFRQSRYKLYALAIDIRSQIRRARNAMIAARDRAEYLSRVIVPLRHQIVQQEQLQFNAMQVGVFELLQAKQNEIDAGRDYVQALQDYWIARVDLERATGGRLPGAASTQPSEPATIPATQPASEEHHHHHHGE